MDFLSNYTRQDDKSLINMFQNAHIVLESTDKLGALYLGDIIAAQNVRFLKEKDITCILTIAKTYLNLPKHLGITTMSIPADDSPIFNLKKHFEDCNKFIHENRLSSKNVLVHCMAGVSRSSTVVIAYLMNINDLDFEASYKFVKAKRSLAYPNGGFLRQLKEYSSELEDKKRNSKFK